MTLFMFLKKQNDFFLPITQVIKPMEYNVLALALGANFCFAAGSQFFTHFTIKLGTYWMNWFKAAFALILFMIWMLLTEGISWPGTAPTIYLFLSGIIGLAIGDLCLLQAFKDLGPGRTLMLFSFQPLLAGTAGHLFFNQGLDAERFWAIFFFILCVFIFSLESFRRDKHWAIPGILMALAGMTLDTAGVIITRSIFDHHPEITPMSSNLYRTLGAVVFFFLFSFHKKRKKLINPFLNLNLKEKVSVLCGSFLGTFLSLALYLTAVQYAHLGSLAGISITAALFSSLFECIWIRKWPSVYLWISFVSFLIGMNILLF